MSTVTGRATSRRPDHHDECRAEVVPDLAPRQVRTERDEHEDHDDVGDCGDERAHVALVLRVHPEPEAIHVADDQSGEERPEVTAPSRGVRREVADRDDGDDCDRGRLLPDAGSPVGDDERKQDPEPDPEHCRYPEVLEEVDYGIGDGGIAARDDAREHEREHGAGRVVQRRLGDRRLLDLLADADAREQRNQDCRIGGCENRADQEPRREGDVEGDRGDRARDERRDDDTGDGEKAKPDGHAAEHADRQLETAVEQDERHAEREQQLGPRRVERHVDRVGDRWAEKRSAEEQHEHARHSQGVGHDLADEARDEHDAEREDDVLRRHDGDSHGLGGRRCAAGRMTAPPGAPYDDAVLIFILLGWVPWPLLLALAVVMWLTVVELLEWRPHFVVVVLVAPARLHDELHRLPVPQGLPCLPAIQARTGVRATSGPAATCATGRSSASACSWPCCSSRFS